MKITNRNGVPQPLVDLLVNDTYSRGESRKSITQLIGPPRQDILKERHDAQIEVEASDRIWLLLGKAFHALAERAERRDRVLEERIFSEVRGWIISGQLDIQSNPDGTVVISDYKVTSVYAAMMEKTEWVEQLNCYAYLVEKEKGLVVSGVEIYAIMRDWDRHKAAQDRSYPQIPVRTIILPLWPMDERRAFLESRVFAHQDAFRLSEWGERLPDCTKAERWVKNEGWAVMLPGKKRAKRVLGSADKANALAAETEGATVVYRPGSPVRCAGYCAVARFCDQYQTELLTLGEQE